MTRELESTQSLTPQALATARWALLGALLVITAVQSTSQQLLGPQFGGPWLPAGIMLVGAALNLGVVRRKRPVTVRSSRLHLIGDVIGLTVFLGISGAAANPFTMLYFVPIALATMLPPRHTWLIAGVALVGFGVLLLITAATTDLRGHFLHHLIGMWLGLAVSGSIITFFVHRIAAALERQRSELLRARQTAVEAQYLAALGGLAATAAHELGTPFGTIGVLAEELDKMSGPERRAATKSIRDEVLRCKTIIHAMANPELSAQQFEGSGPWRLASLVEPFTTKEQLCVALGDKQAEGIAVRIDVTEGAEQTAPSTQPRIVIRRIVKELLNNAIEASRRSGLSPDLTVRIGAGNGTGRVEVEDGGPGFSADARRQAFDAFYSSHERGRGLGLFLARAHLRQLGGDLTIDSPSRSGARVVLEFPLESPFDRSRVAE